MGFEDFLMLSIIVFDMPRSRFIHRISVFVDVDILMSKVKSRFPKTVIHPSRTFYNVGLSAIDYNITKSFCLTGSASKSFDDTLLDRD